MTRQKLLGLVVTAIAATAFAPRASATIKASDNAGNAAYAANPGNGAWQGENAGLNENPPGNDNGGFGFLPWDFGGGYYEIGGPYNEFNHFIDGVDFPASTFNNLGGPAWGLANAGYPLQYMTTAASRPFATPLVVGDTFSADFDSPILNDYLNIENPGALYPFAIISFQNSAGDDTFVIETGTSGLYGDFNWRYNDTATTKADFGGITPAATTDGSSIKLKMTSATQAQVTLDGVQKTVNLLAGAPARVTFVLYENDAGSGTIDGDGNPLVATPNGKHEFFFDNFLIQDSAAIPGDFNGDGSVNQADLVQWKGDFGIDGGSDADGDGDSDGNDLLIWQRHESDAHATPNVGAVPEPASLGLAIGAGLLLALRGRRR